MTEDERHEAYGAMVHAMKPRAPGLSSEEIEAVEKQVSGSKRDIKPIKPIKPIQESNDPRIGFELSQWELEQAKYFRSEVERLRRQCEGLANVAMANGQDLLLHERQVATLREALFGLNAAIDAFWNDDQRPPLHQMRSISVKVITTWQTRARAALAATEKKNGD